jgi:hypothetical protein
VVDTVLDVAGGFSRSGLERMFRDARLGRIHPANGFLTRELVAKTALGIPRRSASLGLVGPPAGG